VTPDLRLMLDVTVSGANKFLYTTMLFTV